MGRAEERLLRALARVESEGLGQDSPGGRTDRRFALAGYAKAIIATLVAVVGGFVTATMDASAGGSAVVANEGWTIVATGLAALALVYAVPNKPSA